MEIIGLVIFGLFLLYSLPTHKSNYEEDYYEPNNEFEGDINKEEPEYFIEKYLDSNDYSRYKFKKLKKDAKSHEYAINNEVNNMSYDDFLNTPYWRTIAHKVKKEAGFNCEQCRDIEDLEVHHLTYEHHGKEHLYFREDLICLCRLCHQNEHDTPNLQDTYELFDDTTEDSHKYDKVEYYKNLRICQECKSINVQMIDGEKLRCRVCGNEWDFEEYSV